MLFRSIGTSLRDWNKSRRHRVSIDDHKLNTPDREHAHCPSMRQSRAIVLTERYWPRNHRQSASMLATFWDHTPSGTAQYSLFTCLVFRGHFIVRDRDTLAPTAVLTVQPHDCMGGCARATKEVEHFCVSIICDEVSKGVFHRIE